MERLFPLLLVLYEITTYLSMDMYLPALPTIPHELHTTHALAQLTIMAFFLGSASMQLILGPISDRYGRRPVLLTGGWIYIVATFTCAITSHIYLFLLARFLQGAVICSVIVAGYATIHELYDQKKAIRVLALMGSITILAPSFGPLAGALVIHYLNWRAVFYILGIWAVLAILALTLWMPESNPVSKRHPLSIKLLLKNYISILTNMTFMRYTLCFCFAFLGMIAWITTGPFLVTVVYQNTSIVFGIYQIIVFGNFILVNYIVKILIERISVHSIIKIGLSIGFVGSILSVLTAYFIPEYLTLFIIALTIFTGGSALAFSPINRLAVEACKEPMGTRMAISSTIMNSFGMLGSIAASLFYNETALSLAWIIFITMTFGCAGVVGMLHGDN